MSFAPMLSIIAPLVGLVMLLAVARIPLLQPYRRFVVPTAALLSFLGVLFVPLEAARVVIVSRWQPSAFFGASPALRAWPGMWALALAFSLATAASALVQLSRVPQPRALLGIAGLGMLAAGLAGLWSDNLLMALIAWAGFDLAWGVGALAVGLPARRIALGVGLGGLATMALWAGALLAEGRGVGVSWRFLDVGGAGGVLLMIAALLRLGVYPFHLALPGEEGWELPGAAPLLLGPLLGLGLLAQLAGRDSDLFATAAWMEVLAVVTFIGGGALAWTRSGAGGGWPWGSLAALGGLLWASLHAEATASVLAVGGAAWAAGTTLLHLHRGVERSAPWWSVAAGLGGLALLGAPLTGGWAASSALVASLVAAPTAARVVGFLVGQALLTTAMVRRVLRPAAPDEPAGPLATAARSAGLASAVLLLLFVGFLPRWLAADVSALALPRLLTRPGLSGWLLWGVGSAIGGAFARWERRLRRRVEAVLGLLHDLLRMEWASQLLLNSLGRSSAFLGAVADVVEGPGAILWALAIFMLVMLIIVGR